MYYDRYENLQDHFEKSHYACIERDCLDKCFIAFKGKDELEDHLIRVHKQKVEKQKVYFLDGQTEDTGKLFDTNGVDMKEQLLSMKKKKHALSKDDFFDNRFDIREYFSKKRQRIYSNKEFKARRDRKNSDRQDIKDKDEEETKEYTNSKYDKNKTYIEDLTFLKYDVLSEQTAKQFFERIKEDFN